MSNVTNRLSGIARGATVLDFTGEKIGTVTEVDEDRDYIQVEKGWLFHKDFYVPATDVSRVDEVGSVILNLSRHDLDESYDYPPMPDKTHSGAGLTTVANAKLDVPSRSGAAESSGPADEYSDSAAALGSDPQRWPVDGEDA